MANPGSGDKCAHATAAMRDRVCLSWLYRQAPRDHSQEPVRGNGKSRDRYFALAAASFLHSAMNFLRSLPWTALVSASLEHTSDAAVRGFAAFFSAGAAFATGAAFAAGAGVAGGVVCAKAELINSRDAKAVAATREDMVIMGAPR